MDWPSLLVGGIIGGIVSYIVAFIFMSISMISMIRNPYKGTYYSYHLSTIDDKTVTAHKWKIYRKLTGEIGVRLCELNHDSPLSYKGTLRVKERYIYVHLMGVNHAEEMFAIFPEPIDRVIKCVHGILSAISMDKNPWSGKELLVDKELSCEEAKNNLGSG